MELVVASTVMMTALTSMAYVTTSAFSDIAMAKERQTANALLDQAIEQLRALPYDTVSLGMRTSDLAGDPRVIGSGTTGAPYRLASTNDRIVHVSTNQVIAPLVPNVSSRTIDNKVYAVRVYLTHFQDDPATGAVTATAYVDWTSSARNAGQPAFLRASTVIFSPAAASAGTSGACLSTATHPFSGPCLAFFHGQAAASGGQIALAGDGILGAVLNGTGVGIPWATSMMQIEQTVSVEGRGTAAGVTVGSTRSGYATSETKADNDPASVGSTGYDSKSAGVAANASSARNTTTFTLSANGNSSRSVSTTAATSAQVCQNVAGTANLTDGLPCGRSEALVGNLTTELGLGNLDLIADLLGSITPFRISNMTSTAHTDRNANCAGAGGAGCIRSTASRAIESLRIGGLPSGRSLVKLETFTSTAMAEAGIGAAAPTASAAGTLSIWDPNLLGGSYKQVPFDFGAGTTLTAEVSPDDYALHGIGLTVSAQLRGGSIATSSTAATCTGSLPCRTRADATAASPLTATVLYRFTYGTRVISFTITLDLGNVSASASYADPPSTA